MNTPELDRLLRDSHPAGPRTHEGITAQQREVMRHIMATPEKRRPARRVALVALPLGLATVIAVVLGFFTPFAAGPAVAYGAPQLAFTATGESFDDVVRTSQEHLGAEPGVTEAVRRSASVAWNATIRDDGGVDPVTFISPVVTDLTWNADLSGRRIVSAGEPYAVAGDLPEAPDAPTPGTVLDDQVFAAGEYPAYLPDAGGLTGESAAELLAQYAPTSTQTPGDAMWAVADLLNEWTLTNAQHGYLLDALRAYDGITVLGEATGRDGRPVIGVQGSASGGQAVTLLISADTGRIVGIEMTVVSDDAAFPVPVGTVISYTLWKDTQ